MLCHKAGLQSANANKTVAAVMPEGAALRHRRFASSAVHVCAPHMASSTHCRAVRRVPGAEVLALLQLCCAVPGAAAIHRPGHPW
jgi:hypothetical protein